MSHSLFHGKKFAPLVLPAVYDDVLSYEEWLSKVIYSINELQEYIDKTMENIEQIIDNSVTNKIAPVKADIDVIKGRLNNIDKGIENLDKSIKSSLKKANEYTDSVNNKTNKKFDKIISELQKVVEKYFNELKIADKQLKSSLELAMTEADLQTLKEAKRYTHHIIGVNNNKIYTEIENLAKRVDNILNEYPELYDPATGETEHMQKLIYNMFRALRTFGIPSMLYDDQQLTAEEYDAMGLDSQVYDTAMVWRLWYKFKFMFNPVTGKQESLADIVNFLFTQLRWNGKTVDEFEAYEATVDDIDNSTYTAWEQDNSKYYTKPAVNLKDKAYRNWVLLAQDTEGITSVDFNGREYNDICMNYGADGLFTIPAIDGSYLAPNGNTISISNGVATFVGAPIIVYGINYVTDITELNK